MDVNVSAEILKIYKDDDRFFESDRMKTAFDRLFALFPSSNYQHQQNFSAQLSAAFLDILNGGIFKTLIPQTPIDLNEKVDALLRSASAHPRLMSAIKYALLETEKAYWRPGSEEFWKNYHKVPFFDVLLKYPELSHGLNKFVRRHLISSPEFHHILKQIENTSCSAVVTPEIMDALKQSMLADKMNKGNAQRGAVLKSIPAYWSLFETKVSDFFLAYTPHVREDQLPPPVILHYVGNAYYLDYDLQKKFVAIRFDKLVTRDPIPFNTGWIQNYIDVDHLQGCYKILQHSLDVLNGDAQGVTSNMQWVAHQKKFLIPALKADVSVLLKEMKANRLGIPSWPPVSVPMVDAGNASYISAPKRGFFPAP